MLEAKILLGVTVVGTVGIGGVCLTKNFLPTKEKTQNVSMSSSPQSVETTAESPDAAQGKEQPGQTDSGKENPSK